MQYGELDVTAAAGTLLAHGLRGPGYSFRKGRVLDAADIECLLRGGRRTVISVRLDEDDVPEDAAAAALAAAVAGDGVRVSRAATGRANLFAAAAGIAMPDTARVHALNRLDESVTLATLPPCARVGAGQMVATVKIIPFAVPRRLLDMVLATARTPAPMLRVACFSPLRVALVQTRLPGMRHSLLSKAVAVTRSRLAGLGSTLSAEVSVAHEVGAVAAALAQLQAQADLLLVLGASAVVDRRDVIPAAVNRAGGHVRHFGMPVDPGNLLLFGVLGAVPVIGLPGCARSPKLNGCDWVLERLAAGLPVDDAWIMSLGVGGLLAEIPTRPMPRERAAPDVAGG